VAETSKDKAYIRQGDKTIELRDSERREFEYSKGLLKKHGDKLQLTKAAILLLGKDPCMHFPGAYIRFLRYSGIEKKTGQEQNLIKDEFFKEPLPRLIIRIKDFLKTQLRDFTYLGPDSKFITEPEYPEPALLEAIVNAVVHRSYSQMNMFIRIEMYDDRIEIQSPGDYRADVNPREFIHHARNHRLMDGMQYLGFVQMLSEGSLRMKQEMERANLPSPDFSLPGNSYVRVILRNDIERRKLKQKAGENSANEFTNFFRITWSLEKPQENSQQPPNRQEIGQALLDALKA
jgi:ATP-dependent DNA helicase RecG